MPYQISRRKFIGTTSAGVAAATVTGGPAVFAQDKPTVKVGSKDFTEQLILGEIIAQLLEDNGYPVERQFNIGTLIVHEAMVNGDVDTYIEYTGTGLIAILGHELPPRNEEGSEDETASTPEASGSYAEKVYDIVAEDYPEEFGVEWLEPWGFNNTYAIAMRREHAEELGITKISELTPIAGDLTLGSTAETIAREDGVIGLEKVYGLEFGDVMSLDLGLLYSALRDGEVDVITCNSTEGRIQSMDLVVLEDDLEFYPPYYAAPVVRQDLLEEAPEVADILNTLAGEIDDARITELNFLADGEGQEPADIVRTFLTEGGYIEG